MGAIGDATGIYGQQNLQDQPAPTYDNADQMASGSLDLAKPAQLPSIPFKSITTTYDENGQPEHTLKGISDKFYQDVQQRAAVGSAAQQAAPVIENRLQSLIAERDHYKSILGGQIDIAQQEAAQTQGAFGDAISGLRAKRDMLNANPLLAGIGRIASLAAANYAGGPQANRIAPAVHAAGAYGLDTFGQSPDNLNQQIAGLSSQAQASQIPYTNLLEKAQTQANTAIEHELSLDEKKGRDAEAARAHISAENQRIHTDAGRDVRSGAFDPEAYIQARMGLPGADAEAVASAAKSLSETQDNIQNLKDAREKNKEAATAAALDKRLSFENMKLQATLASSEKLAKMRMATTDKKQNDNELKVSPLVEKELAGYAISEKALNRIEELVKDPKINKYMSDLPIVGSTMANARVALARNDKYLAQAMTEIKTQTANAIHAMDAGARGFGPQERPFFASLSEGVDRSMEQNLGIIEAWRRNIRDRRAVAADLHRGIRERPDLYAKSFGRDAAGNFNSGANAPIAAKVDMNGNIVPVTK